MMLVPTIAVSCAKEVGKNLAIYSSKESKTQKTTDATDVLNKKKNHQYLLQTSVYNVLQEAKKVQLPLGSGVQN